MKYLLSIDTSLDTARVCLSENDNLIVATENHTQKDHATWLQPAIRSIFNESGLSINKLDAVSVVAGPGSYTGLRVGMASAKGLCYALNIPLITMNALYLMAFSFKRQFNERGFISPMIDARRMEVFSALYDENLRTVLAPDATILETDTFNTWLNKNTVFFIGNGAAKYKVMLKSGNASFPEWMVKSNDLVLLTHEMYNSSSFADIKYAEPFYIKAFYHPVKAKS